MGPEARLTQCMVAPWAREMAPLFWGGGRVRMTEILDPRNGHGIATAWKARKLVSS